MVNMEMISKRKRMTKQKKLIFDVLASTTCHPTADWIYEEARKVLPDISLGTVYRNLQVLLEENKIQELNYGKSQSRFDANPALHYHFVCNECGEVLDCQGSVLPLDQIVDDSIPGRADFYRLEFYGICQQCLNKKMQ
ncbi:MAG: transcriptional repressor [Clostridiales bacterium]